MAPRPAPRPDPSAAVEPLPVEHLRWTCDPATLGFASTEDLPDIDRIIGQDRAVQAIRFAIGVRHHGYNLFALGPGGVGKHHVLRRFLEQEARQCPVPGDWCYVHPMGEDTAPRALGLPAGEGPRLRDDVAKLVASLKVALPAAFEGDDYLSRRQRLRAQAEKDEEAALAEVKVEARAHDLVVLRAEDGVVLAPLKDGEVIPNEQFETLPTAEREHIEAELAVMSDRVYEAVRRLPSLKKKAAEAQAELDREVGQAVVGPAFAELRAAWAHDEVRDWLHRFEQDVMANLPRFLPAAEDEVELPEALEQAVAEEGGWVDLRRYKVNVLVSHQGRQGAPVVREDDPTLGNLLGRVEHVAAFGALTTDFTRIRPGALHKANGGFLLLEARRLLEEPLAWEHLKQALRHSELRIPSPSLAGGVVTAITLEPQPIPLQVKVVLVGERLLYYLLNEGDPELSRLFKVTADFEEDMPRTAESQAMAARLLATLAREESLRPLDASAVARTLEESVRLAGDQGRLSTHVESLVDLLREADHAAGLAGRSRIEAQDVASALKARRYREGRLEERTRRQVLEGLVRLPTEGQAVGEVNGLAVLELGRTIFGQATRLGARVRLGDGDIVDIEHEVELGGPIHSKGVHILKGFLGGRFGSESPLSFSATVAFEQSYGEVEGDSASLAETCALLSALAELPLRQDLAVTGSVDQQGRVQAVGGVNEKVEGWYDLCAARGLSGTQGVIVPRATVPALQLRPDLVQAAREGRFAVYAVEDVDQAVALLTGVPAGRRTARGGWTRGSVNARVAARLARMTELARSDRGEG
ncbi:AAA family ATPase [Myxococcota bacterium]|nr:AAA family ATPase [Myxococcota bacterium]